MTKAQEPSWSEAVGSAIHDTFDRYVSAIDTAASTTNNAVAKGWVRYNTTAGGRVLTTLWDRFFELLFRGWGFPDSTFWSPQRPPAPHVITARVEAALAADEARMLAAAEQAMRARAAAAEATRQHDAPAVSVTKPARAPDVDARPPVQPVNLDVVALPPPPTHDAPTSAVRVSTLHIEADSDWCTCEGLAGQHRRGDHAPPEFLIDLPEVPSM